MGSKLPGTWITEFKVDGDYLYFIFLKNGTYETNYFGHYSIKGTYIVDGEQLILEYKNNATVVDITYSDETYNVLKIRHNTTITVFKRDTTV